MGCMLTTIDNPYDPFSQFDEWYAYDEAKGYHSSAYLARVVRTANDLSTDDQNRLIEDAIDEIVELNLTGKYKKVVQK